MKRALLRCSLVAFGLLVGAVLGELTLRLVGVGFPRPFHPDPYCGTRLTPGFSGVWLKEGRSSFRVNSAGFRDREHSLEKPENTLRIAVVGDSYVEALQVEFEDSVSAQLEKQLRSRPECVAENVEVLSFGVSGHGAGQQLMTLRHHVGKFNPDIVVLAFFAGNDIADNSKPLAAYKVKPFFQLVDNELSLDDSFLEHPDFKKANQPSTAWKVRLINASRLLQLASEFRDAGRRPGKPDTPADGPGVDDIAFVEPELPEWKRAWEVTEALLAAFHEEVEDRDAKFLLAALSTDIQVHPKREARDAYRQRIAADDLEYYERRLKKLAESEGFSSVFLAGPMRDHAESHDEYLHGFPNSQMGEGHWNEAGHRLGAKLIADAICEMLGDSVAK